MWEFLNQAQEIKRAQAVMQGEIDEGLAEFTEYQVGTQTLVKVKLHLKGDPTKLTPGKHAVHIHEKGECDCEGFKCAGGHFDPGPSGNADPDANHPFHAGDLPNIEIDETGEGTLECITTRITLSSGPSCIISPDAPEGTALMVHAKQDPYHGGESGSGVSGGPRLACGVIKSS